jgi:hypothetical protein
MIMSTVTTWVGPGGLKTTDLFLIRSPQQPGSRAPSQVATPVVLSGSDRRIPRSMITSGTRRARPSDPRSMQCVPSVRRDPYPQVSVLPSVRHRCHGPVPSGQSVRKLLDIPTVVDDGNGVGATPGQVVTWLRGLSLVRAETIRGRPPVP